MANTTGEALNKVSDLMTQVFSQLDVALKQYGPQGVHLVEQIVRWDAVGALLVGVILVVIGWIVAAWAVKFFRQSKDLYGDEAEFHQVGGVLAFFIGLVPAIVGLVKLVNVWNWVSIFNPAVGLAHKIVMKVLGSG